MADISKITLPNGDEYNLKDDYLRHAHYGYYIPLDTKTYTNVIATANDNNGAGFFYLKVRPTTFNSYWHVKTRVIATVPGYANYYTDTIFNVFGYDNVVSWYACLNRIKSISYKPIYYNSVFLTNSTGYNNDCGHWIGVSLFSSTNPTSTSYKRTIEVQLLECIDCTAELQDNLITPTNIPNRAAHTGWYTSTNTNYPNYDACNYGLKQSGDANTDAIGFRLRINDTVRNVSDTARYYKIYFTSADDTMWVPASVDSTNNTTSARPVNQRPIDPFGPIVYTSANTNYTAGSNLAATTIWEQYAIALGYSFNRTGAALTLTAEKPVYVKCAPQTNGSAIMDANTPIVQALPTTNDGKIYIYLGIAYDATHIELQIWHPVYWHDGTGIRLWTGASISRNNVTYTQNSNINVAGTTKTTYTYDQTAIYAPNGLIMGGTAAAAGLVTRGICGVNTPSTGGACTKDNLFINYDGDNTYRSDRQLVLQAGATGTHYGSNLYQYCAARGDAVKGYIDSRVANYGMLPAVTSSDNDKVLKVENGVYTLGSGGSSATAMTDAEIEAAVDTGWGVLISFYIQSPKSDALQEYQAVQNMTWEQWCSSSYNTQDFTVRNDKVYFYSYSSYYVVGETTVNPADVIVANYEYRIGIDQAGGGGNN